MQSSRVGKTKKEHFRCGNRNEYTATSARGRGSAPNWKQLIPQTKWQAKKAKFFASSYFWVHNKYPVKKAPCQLIYCNLLKFTLEKKPMFYLDE